MQVPPTVLRKKIGFWQTHNLIKEVCPNVYMLNEEQETKESVVNHDVVVEDYESESAMASAQDQREEELQVRL